MALSLASRLRSATVVLLVTLLAATTFAELGRYFWFFDLFVHFRLQYTAAFAVACVMSVIASSRLLVALAALGVAINGLQVIMPAAGTANAGPQESALAIRIVTYNVFLGREDDHRVAEFLAASGADVIVLQEFPTARIPELLASLPGFPHWTAAGAATTHGAVIVSRWPIVASAAVPLSDHPTHVTRAEIEVAGREFVVYGAHLQWPLVPRLALLRDSELETLARELVQCPGACVVVGDFNVTQWSSHFRRLLQSSGLTDCAADHPLLTSWPTFLAPARIRIDHCLVDDQWQVRNVSRGPALGSDHFPMIYDLALMGGAVPDVTPKRDTHAEAPPIQMSRVP